jgi:DNA recombination-dependent growth factor C
MERQRTPADTNKDSATAHSVTHKLVIPIEIEGVMSDSVTVKRLKVRHRLEIQKSKIEEADKEARLISAATGLSPSDVSELDMADYLAIQEIIEGFFSARAKT